ncbi:hypothetical protein HF313_22985 [Massilia atriviolacea]|uniref:Uncharacterized protein n=1 Tax=Massilia atriviolacea TaxID=2495579 RepID=A0A430HCF4_9BURK|nr:hypothetical protein [Massilia atriviolacea]RSZ55171.1 hypothetical protein EJB06_30905 [Massilia atriviolacea]
MSALIDMLRSLFRPSAGLSPLEASIFDAVHEQLPPQDAELWRKQLEAVNKIYRSPTEREINLYVIRNGKSNFPRELCFANEEEFKIAVVDLTAGDNEGKLRARVWCVNGHVFSIEYKTSFKVFEEMAQGKWRCKCKILNYPS